jgi:alkylation response protein AidB-like acyl-CoA dehydrogenase
MFVFDEMPLPTLGLSGLEGAMSEEEKAIQESAHRFAAEVMRPLAEKVDKMSAEDAVAADSPLFSYYEQMKESGLLDIETMGTLENEEKARLLPIIFEELAWGDCGLMLGSMVTSFPSYAARLSGDESLIEQFDGRLGCWMATQPDRGSDVVDMDGDEIHEGTRQNRPNLHARIDGNEVVVTGQSSAWVSAAPFAETTLAYLPCDYGDGLYNDDGSSPQICLLIDLDDPRISKGKPLDKLGIRTLPQGEVFFDEVRMPLRNAVAQGDAAVGGFMGTLTFANMEMGFSFTGVARAAYEHALAYVHERKQGGTELINHQSVRMRLFDIWRKVEACRAMSRRVAQYNFGPNGPHLLASVTSKTFVTQTCFEAVSEALQLFGGNGLTKEYAMEKLLRDARASLIADGENNILSLKGADWLSKWYTSTHL